MHANKIQAAEATPAPAPRPKPSSALAKPTAPVAVASHCPLAPKTFALPLYQAGTNASAGTHAVEDFDDQLGTDGDAGGSCSVCSRKVASLRRLTYAADVSRRNEVQHSAREPDDSSTGADNLPRIVREYPLSTYFAFAATVLVSLQPSFHAQMSHEYHAVTNSFRAATRSLARAAELRQNRPHGFTMFSVLLLVLT
eukprot:2440610-Pleurochrysis_carterae.AAC.9